jgi:hypothetical protein
VAPEDVDRPTSEDATVFACADCDPRSIREALLIGFARPARCDACGEVKVTTEYVWARDMGEADARGRAIAGAKARHADAKAGPWKTFAPCGDGPVRRLLFWSELRRMAARDGALVLPAGTEFEILP